MDWINVGNIKGPKGDSGDPSSFKTINGESIVGTGDIVINANTPLWISGTVYTEGGYVISPLSSHVYMRRTNGSGTTDPAIDKTNWRLIGAGGIKSIQRGAISMSIRGETAAVTISPVSISSCNLVLMGAQYTGAGNFATSTMQVRGVLASLELTNSTTITASRGASANQDLGAATVFWELTEYWS